MLISDLLSQEMIRLDVHCSSKKKLLEIISQELARNSEDLNAREVFESLCARERLGSTGLGQGVAIPHARVKDSKTIQTAFIRLRKPLPFDSVDGEPVDLLFAMTIPENCNEDHLKLLAHVAELFGDPQLLRALRKAETSGALLKLITGNKSKVSSGTHR